VEKLIRAGLRDPVLVSVREKVDQNEDARTPSGLSNYYLLADPPESKLAILVAFLKTLPADAKAMLFLSTCAAVEYLSLALDRLLRGRLPIMSIHGKKAKREKDFNRFRQADKGRNICIVCTVLLSQLFSC